MASKSTRKCVYTECKLPANNNRYWSQLLCLVLGFFAMLINSSSFSFLSVFLYVTPIAVDLYHTEYINRGLNTLKHLFLVLNLFIVIFCFLGLIGFLIDLGDAFAVSESALIFSGRMVPKKALIYVLLVDLVVPVSMVYGTPNQKSSQAIAFALSREKT